MHTKCTWLIVMLCLCTSTQLLVAQKVSFPGVPGVVVDHSPASSGQYIGSPSICVLPDGSYLASHDLFGPESKEYEKAVSCIFRSSDKGRTWKQIAVINGQFWSSLFVHQDALYIIGPYRHYGNLVIRESKDGGITWTEPVDSRHGLLLEGSYHTAPTPIIVHDGRIWRAMEHVTGPKRPWARMFGAFMLSAPVNADLLQASSWTASNELYFDSTYLHGTFNGWLEGNAVVDPGGNMLDILRTATTKGTEYASFIHISSDGTTASFDPQSDFVPFPGGSKKFTIQYDPQSHRYWALSNYIPDTFREAAATDRIRNILALCSSKDLHSWTVHKIVLQHPDVEKHAFQYVDWQFDGKDIIVLSRTAYDDREGGAHSFHDANFLTFHRIKNFRKLGRQTIK